MKKRRLRRFRKTVSTVRKSHSRMLAACRAETQPSWTRAAAARARSPRAGGFPNGAGRDADAESNELALDAPVPPAGILAHQPHHQLTHIVRCRWRPGRRCGYVQRRATSSRCQRSSVAGDTRNDDHARRGSARLSAASSARSAERSCGRAIWRSSTLVAQDEISISFSRSDCIRSTNSSSRRRSTQYRNENTMPRERPTSTADPTG
jgi:hypothetical protein